MTDFINKSDRHTTAQLNTLVPVEGDVLMDTTKNVLVIGGGSVQGGTPMAKESLAFSFDTPTYYYPSCGGYDDLRFPLTGQRLDTSAGRVDYNYSECSVDFAANTRYPEEVICFIVQFPHSKCFGSPVYPHLHWVQEEDNIPNWLIEYRWYNNGGAVPATFTKAIPSRNVSTYVSGSILQITDFPAIPAVASESLSSILDVRLFRDTGNVSTLFDGADPYTTAAKAKEFDLHIQIDSVGSGEEYTK